MFWLKLIHRQTALDASGNFQKRQGTAGNVRKSQGLEPVDVEEAAPSPSALGAALGS